MIRRFVRVAAAAFGAAIVLVPSHVRAQDASEPERRDGRHSLDLGVGGAGISIGDSRRWTGLRLNYRDSRLVEANGINATLWYPYEDGAGDVTGLALGLPVTGARRLTGLGVGVFGFGVEERFRGLGVAGVGMGGGGDMSGIMLAGVGMGGGGDISGLSVAGIGLGSGGNLRGIAVAGVGAGMGGNMTGLFVAGVGAGAGGDVRGIGVGGIGLGAGGDLTGIAIGGVGVGAGGDVTGLIVGGVGAGFGGTLRGVGIGGVGVGGARIRGVAIGGVGVGGMDLKGGFLTPGIFRVERGGRFQGVAVAGYSQIRGTQRGLTIGVVNYARRLRGVQIGLINIAKSNPRGSQVLPVFNADFSR